MAQVAFSVVALVGAGLFVRSLRNAMRFDPGFDSAHLGIVVFNVADDGFNADQGRDFQRRALERARAIPGVAAATLSNDWPFHVSLSRTMSAQDREGSGRIILSEFVVARIPAGGGHSARCAAAISPPRMARTSPRVAIVNRAAADAYWPGEDPVGKRVKFFGETTATEVIGSPARPITRPSGRNPDLSSTFRCCSITSRPRCCPFAPPAIPRRC